MRSTWISSARGEGTGISGGRQAASRFKVISVCKKEPPGHPKRAQSGRDLLRQTFVCEQKLARQQYNRKRCDVVKNYLAPCATPSRCRTSVCLGASSPLASCPGAGQSRGRGVLEMAAAEYRVWCLSSFCLPSCWRGIIRRRCV